MLQLVLSEPILAAALVLCAAVGVGAGLVGGWPTTRPLRIAALILAASVLAGLALSLSALVPGRAGLWLDGMAPCLAAYGLGSLAGVAVRSLARRRSLKERSRFPGAGPTR